MKTPTVPILIPGRTDPVCVPFALDPSFGFDVLVFLPDWGVRAFSVALNSRDLTQAEIHDVQPHGADLMRRHLTEAEQRAAEEAAGDVLDAVGKALNLMANGKPDPTAALPPALVAIARAYLAEVAAYEASVDVLKALPRDLHSPVLLGAPPETNPYSAARTMLDLYVDWCFEQACKAQADKAQKQAAEWEPPPAHPEDRPLAPWLEH